MEGKDEQQQQQPPAAAQRDTGVYTPRLKKVLKSYQAAATTSLNGPNCYPDVWKGTGAGGRKDDERTRHRAEEERSNVVEDDEEVDEEERKGASSGSSSSSSASLFAAAAAVKQPPCTAYPPPPILIPPDSSATDRSETIVEGQTISCFGVGGERRLCLPQILNTVLREFSLQQINYVCDELQIYCSRCSPTQLDVLKMVEILPSSAPSCGLITQTDAERLCSELLHSQPPADSVQIASRAAKAGSFSLRVYHECFGKCMGAYYPDLYTTPDAGCLECSDCHGFFSPKTFVLHSHRSKEKRTCHWGFDSNNWRAYVLLAKEHKLKKVEELEEHLLDMKARFDDYSLKYGKRRKFSVQSIQSLTPSKKIKVEPNSMNVANIIKIFTVMAFSKYGDYYSIHSEVTEQEEYVSNQLFNVLDTLIKNTEVDELVTMKKYR